MSALLRKLAELEAHIARLEARSPASCCSECRLPMDGEARERLLHHPAPGSVVAMKLYTEGDEIPSRFCEACRMRRELEVMRLTFDDAGLTGEVEVLAAPAGEAWEGDQ